MLLYDIKIDYTGGENNLRRYLPENFQNNTYQDTGDLHLLGASIEIMSPQNEKYIRNIEYSIKILEYMKSTIGLKEAASLGMALLGVELYTGAEQSYINMASDFTKYGNTVNTGNPMLGDILKDEHYIDPVIMNIDDLSEKSLEDALMDLKEHQAIGAADNFILVFTQFNLIVIEVMAILFLIFGGLVWLTAGGEESQIERGKKIIIWAVVGIIGGLVSYALLNIIIQIFTS